MKLIGLLLIAIGTAASAHPSPKTYLCYRADSPVVIDGKLDDLAWQQAPWSDRFVDIEGDLKPVPRFDTHVKMLWDSGYFYVAARLEEPHVWATIVKHDEVIFHDNDFEVFMDPDADNFEYGEFEINALNTSWDLFLPKPYRDDGHAENAWEIEGIHTAVFIDGTLNNPTDSDRGWTVEIALPWASLERISHTQEPPADGRQWRVNFSRVEWSTNVRDGKYQKVEGRPEDNWVWSPQGAINMHLPERWGIVQFSTRTEGLVAIIPDPFAETRMLLHEVYYAEKRFYEVHKRWTADGSDLGLDARSAIPNIVLGDSGYVASVSAGPTGMRAYIRQDSRFWTDSIQTR